MIAVVMSVLLIVLGAAIAARTVFEGVGGGAGLLIGALFVAAGAGRLFLARRS